MIIFYNEDTNMNKLHIQHDVNQQHFFVKINNDMCQLNYRKISADTLEYYRTFIPEGLRGRGIAGDITKFALQYALDNHYFVIASCTYVKVYIQKHPEFESLVRND